MLALSYGRSYLSYLGSFSSRFSSSLVLQHQTPKCITWVRLNHRKPASQVISSFDDSRESFKSRTTLELFRAYAVFTLCQWRWLVDNSERILKIATSLIGVRPINAILRVTFFGHFCAGTDENNIRPSVERLRSNGVGVILDYAAEADITTPPTCPPRPSPAAAAIAASKATLVTENYTRGAVQCRLYNYEGELNCDKNVQNFLSCIRAVHKTTPEGFAAVKVTALGQPKLLERISTAILCTRALFARFDRDGNGKITADEFRKAFSELFRDPSDSEIEAIFHRFDSHHTGYVDYVEWTNYLRIAELLQLMSRARITQEADTATTTGKVSGTAGFTALTEEENELMGNMIERLNTIADYAARLEVRLMVDAEHTYFQPAIDHMVLHLQRKYNKKSVIIFNTYQCYLKDCYERLQNDLERAKRESYFFGAKVVRGAYMVLERKRAEEMGYEDPIQPTIEATHQSFYRAIDLILDNLSFSNLILATHNQDSISYTLKMMEALNIPPYHGRVFFGQLLGMSDNLTFNLGNNGYKAYKYVPYGPVEEVVPYLIRRAQENSEFFGSAIKEVDMIRGEIKRRLTKGK